MRIEPFDPARHDIGAITALLHAAHAPYTAQGFRYTSATQDDAHTLARLLRGVPFIGVSGDAIVGTVTYYTTPSEVEIPLIPWFLRPDVGTFGQYAVAPHLQGSGFGKKLLDAVENEARRDGKAELACETVASNAPLVDYYHRRGLRDVGTFRWPGDEVDCVVLSKSLR